MFIIMSYLSNMLCFILQVTSLFSKLVNCKVAPDETDEVYDSLYNILDKFEEALQEKFFGGKYIIYLWAYKNTKFHLQNHILGTPIIVFDQYNVLICIFQNGGQIKLKRLVYIISQSIFRIVCFVTFMSPVIVS